MVKRLITRKWWDTIFPTVVRYLGVALLVYAMLFNRLSNPELLPTAVLLIGFKTIMGKDGNG